MLAATVFGILTIAQVPFVASQVPQVSIDQVEPYEGRVVRVCGTVKSTHSIDANGLAIELAHAGNRGGYFVVADEALKAVNRRPEQIVGSRVCVEGIARSHEKFRAVYAFSAADVQVIPQASEAKPTGVPTGPSYTDGEAASLLAQFKRSLAGGPEPSIDYSRLTSEQKSAFLAAVVSARGQPPVEPNPSTAPSIQAQPPSPRHSDRAGLLLLSALQGFNQGYFGGRTPTTLQPAYTPSYSAGESRIQSVSSGGEVITLLDGSVWVVHELDRLKSSLWLMGPVSVVKSSSYNEYLLVRTDRGDSVRATRANP